MHVDIAYLYSELAVTYHSSEDSLKAITCVKKQLNILDALNKNHGYDYMSSLNFLGELYREVSDSENAIETLYRVVKMQKVILKPNEKYDLILTLKLLAEELINSERLQEGILNIKEAYDL